VNRVSAAAALDDEVTAHINDSHTNMAAIRRAIVPHPHSCFDMCLSLAALVLNGRESAEPHTGTPASRQFIGTATAAATVGEYDAVASWLGSAGTSRWARGA
jgi:hypothetical protein